MKQRSPFPGSFLGGWLWRKKLGRLAAMLGIEDMAGIAAKFGKRWRWHLKESILSADLPMGRAELAGFNPEWLQKWIEEDNPNANPFAGECLCPPAVSVPDGTVGWYACSYAVSRCHVNFMALLRVMEFFRGFLRAWCFEDKIEPLL
jgi:hypothetical protein